MIFVLDTNIIISSLIKNSLSRKFITDARFDFFIPSFSLSEITKYREYICKRSSIDKEEFDLLLDKLFKYIKIIPIEQYQSHIDKSMTLISDKKDASFLACALKLNCPVWSDDKHFKE